MKIQKSRNRREGRYLGVINGRHQRADRIGTKRGESNAHFHEDICDKCNESMLTWIDCQGEGDSQDYGRYVWWQGTSICTHCDSRQGFDDSSI